MKKLKQLTLSAEPDHMHKIISNVRIGATIPQPPEYIDCSKRCLPARTHAPHYFKCEACNGSGCGDGDHGACIECNGFGEVRELP